MSQAPKTHYIQANGLGIRCLEWGAPGQSEADGRPGAALLLHGLTSCAETWSFVAPALAQGMRVLAPDLRGHGETEKPGHGYDYEMICRDLMGLLDELGVGQAAVAGHSWGAGVAAGLAASDPQRVTHLALVDGGFLRPNRPQQMTPEQLEQMLAPAAIYASVQTYLAEVRRTLNGHWSPEIEAIALASIYHNADGSVREKLDREHQKLILRAMGNGRTEDRYALLRCPTLFLASETSHPRRSRADGAQANGHGQHAATPPPGCRAVGARFGPRSPAPEAGGGDRGPRGIFRHTVS